MVYCSPLFKGGEDVPNSDKPPSHDSGLWGPWDLLLCMDYLSSLPAFLGKMTSSSVFVRPTKVLNKLKHNATSSSNLVFLDPKWQFIVEGKAYF